MSFPLSVTRSLSNASDETDGIDVTSENCVNNENYAMQSDRAHPLGG